MIYVLIAVCVLAVYLLYTKARKKPSVMTTEEMKSIDRYDEVYEDEYAVCCRCHSILATQEDEFYGIHQSCLGGDALGVWRICIVCTNGYHDDCNVLVCLKCGRGA